METLVLNPTPESLTLAANLLEGGDCIGLPTETVYGLAANAFDETAILKVYQTKNRPSFDPCILHVSYKRLGSDYENWVNTGLVASTSLEIQTTASILAEAFWPGPLTLILPRGLRISDLITSGLPRVALRAPSHPVAQKLLNSLSFPLVAPSANPFGHVSPTLASHVYKDFNGKIKLILDGGPCEIGIESTVLLLDQELGFRILRQGAISSQALREALESKPDLLDLCNDLDIPLEATQKPMSPGLLSSHYAPRKPFYRLTQGFNSLKPHPLEREIKKTRHLEKCGLLLFSNSESTLLNDFGPFESQPKVISLDQGDEHTAKSLFSSIRELDESDCDFLLCEPYEKPNPSSLSLAIQDRLNRASIEMRIS